MSTRTKRTMAVVGVAALAVTGGTAAASAADLPIPGQPTEPETAAVEQVDERQQWADEKVETWLAELDAETPEETYRPYSWVESWDSPREGVVRLTVDSTVTDYDTDYQSGSSDPTILDSIAKDVMCRPAWGDQPDVVIAATDDGERVAKYTADDARQAHQAEREAGIDPWC